MRSLIVLVLVWLAFQFGSLLIERKPDPSRADARLSAQRVDETLDHWPEGPRDLAKQMIGDYGLPDGAHVNVLWWNRAGDARIVIYRDTQESVPANSAVLSGAVATTRITRSSARKAASRL